MKERVITKSAVVELIIHALKLRDVNAFSSLTNKFCNIIKSRDTVRQTELILNLGRYINI